MKRSFCMASVTVRPLSLLPLVPLVSLFALVAGVGYAGTVTSDAGTFTTAEDVFATTIVLTAPGNVTLQTYGFGGGTNGAGTVVQAGGFDPFVGLFQGTGSTALFLDGTADNLSNYAGEPDACPPAGLVTIGSVTGQCGDVQLQFNALAAGTYTVILSDANYVPFAVYETNGQLGDGFSDLTGGSLPFQTCFDANDCNTDSANWALDITTPTAVSTTPEPATFGFVGIGLAMTLGLARRRRA